MKLPRIYESDYNAAVRKIYEFANHGNPFIIITVHSVEYYEQSLLSDFPSTANAGVIELRFVSRPPDIITGMRWWHLDTEIILVPDKSQRP